MPSTYEFGIIEIDISNTRSVGSDTNTAALAFGAGALAPRSKSFYLEEMNSGDHSYSLVGYGEPDRSWLRIQEVTVDLCESAAASWSIVNSGNGDKTRLVASVLTKAMEDAVNDFLKDTLKDELKEAGVAAGGAWGGPLGSLVGAAIGRLLDSALDFIFTNCDGLVDVGSLAYPIGWRLQQAVLESPEHRLTGSATYVGDHPGRDCRVSNYTVKWYVLWT
ncbi:MAG TPA: hypothetical protein VGG54_03305 [Trebonia sp.]